MPFTLLVEDNRHAVFEVGRNVVHQVFETSRKVAHDVGKIEDLYKLQQIGHGTRCECLPDSRYYL